MPSLRRPSVAATAVAAALLMAACERGPVPLTLEPLPSPAAAQAAEPFVARADDGTIWMSWLERQADSSVALRLSRRAADGTWSTPTDVVRRTDLFVNWADFPSVVPVGEGRLLAHWLQRSGNGKFAYDVMLAESADGGASWSPAVLPHAAGIPAEHGFVSILPRGDGGADVILLDGSAGGLAAASGHEHGAPMQLAMATVRAGSVVESRLLDDRTCDCCQTAAAMTTQGPVVFYRDRTDGEPEVRDIAVLRRVNGTWSAPAPLHRDGWAIASCPVNGPQAAALGDTVAVAWFTGARDTARVNVAFSTDAGATFSAPVRADDGLPTGRVDLELLDGGTAVLSWIERLGGDTAQVRTRLVRRDGSVEPALVVSPSSGARSSGFPRMTRDGDGVLVAWTQPGTPSEVKVARLRAGRR